MPVISITIVAGRILLKIYFHHTSEGFVMLISIEYPFFVIKNIRLNPLANNYDGNMSINLFKALK